jgi:hypothetical protein
VKKISDKKLKTLGRLPFSTITQKPTKVKKVNTKAKAKRTARYRKMLASKEYRAAKAEAMERAGGRCEHTWFDYNTRNLCWATEDLQAHHLRYPKTRPLASTDLLIACKRHHEMLEAAKMHKTRMF